MYQKRIKELKEEIEKFKEKIRIREDYYGHDKLCGKYDMQIKERLWAIEKYEEMIKRGNDLSIK